MTSLDTSANTLDGTRATAPRTADGDLQPAPEVQTTPAPPALRLLVLGGTSWLGGTVADLARRRGHEVTCLARGISGAVPGQVRHVVADRWQDGAYDEVAGSDWDAVLDLTWQPELARSALSALATRAAHWILVSSCSVYADHATPGHDESAAVVDGWTGHGEAPIEEYGAAKVSCETASRDALHADRLLIARAGLIAGYGDTSDRFGYWPARFATESHGAVLVPPLDGPVQVVDVADLARWLVLCAESRTAGTVDAVGEPHVFRDVLEACVEATGNGSPVVESSDPWLQEREVSPWMGPESLPLWLPRPDYAGLMARSNTTATASGLTTRPLGDTVDDSLRWEVELGLHRERKAGLSPERERSLVDALRGPATD